MIALAANMKGYVRLMFAVVPAGILIYYAAAAMVSAWVLRADKKLFMIFMQTVLGTLALMMKFWMFYVIRLK